MQIIVTFCFYAVYYHTHSSYLLNDTGAIPRSPQCHVTWHNIHHNGWMNHMNQFIDVIMTEKKHKKAICGHAIWAILHILIVYLIACHKFATLLFVGHTTESEISCAWIDGWAQDCSNSIANALELLQSCTNQSKHDMNVKHFASLCYCCAALDGSHW